MSCAFPGGHTLPPPTPPRTAPKGRDDLAPSPRPQKAACPGQRGMPNRGKASDGSIGMPSIPPARPTIIRTMPAQSGRSTLLMTRLRLLRLCRSAAQETRPPSEIRDLNRRIVRFQGQVTRAQMSKCWRLPNWFRASLEAMLTTLRGAFPVTDVQLF
jgi:hypothetical protein